MSTYLELCADLATDSGALGSAPAAVTGQTGRSAKCVYWVKEAWRQMQNELRDANFLRAEFEGELVADTLTYSAGDLGITNFARWLEWPNSVSIHTVGDQDDETELLWISHELWRRTYDFGSHDAARPVRCAIAPDGSLCVGPKPDAAYTIRGIYQRAPQVLAANSDEPLLPERFHSAIVYRAEMLLCAADEAWDAYRGAQAKYTPILLDIQRDCLPALTTGGNAIDR